MLVNVIHYLQRHVAHQFINSQVGFQVTVVIPLIALAFFPLRTCPQPVTVIGDRTCGPVSF